MQKTRKWSMDKLTIDGKVIEVKKDAVKDVNLDTTEQAMKLQKESHPVPLWPTWAALSKVTASRSHRRMILCQRSTSSTPTRVLQEPLTTYTRTGSRLTAATWSTTRMTVSGEQAPSSYRCSGSTTSRTNLCVCHAGYGGQHIGRVRFDHIINAAKGSLNIEYWLLFD